MSKQIPKNYGWVFCIDGPLKNLWAPISHEGGPKDELEFPAGEEHGPVRYIRSPKSDTLGIYAYRFEGEITEV
jgi:hypothetical protein